MPLIRLTERCFLFGRMHEAGETVRMPEGMRGPHQTVQQSHDRIHFGADTDTYGNRIIGDVVDAPLYDVIEEPLP